MNPLPSVLVVEDEPAIARLLAIYLREAGWMPLLAPDGLTALRLWGDHAPELVLLDVMLPDLSGWEICEALRTESAVPILMLTAKASDCDVVHGLTVGADDYLAKPFSQAQLLARIEALMRRAHAQPQPAPPDPPAPEEPPAEPVAPASPPPPPPGSLRLRQAREAAGLTLYLVERRTGIRWDYLQALEQGAFEALPRAILRDTMLGYCQFLHVDARPLFEQAQRSLLASATRTQSRPFPGLMVALGAAIVVLLVLPWLLL